MDQIFIGKNNGLKSLKLRIIGRSRYTWPFLWLSMRTVNRLVAVTCQGCTDEDSPTIPVVSFLDRLKRPQLSELNRQRKRKVNVHPVPARRSTTTRRSSSSNSSEPKKVKPGDRVTEYRNEPFKVSCGKLFCEACREELNLKSTVINNHIRS